MKGNKKDKTTFVTLTIFYALCTMAFYRKCFFIVLPEHSLASSKIILWLIESLSVGIGIAINYNKQRNNLSVLSSVLLGFCVYAALSFKFFREIITPFFIAAAILAILLAIIMFAEKCKIKTKISNSLINTHRLMAFASIIVVAPLLGRIFFGGSLVKSEVRAVMGVNSEESIANNMDTLINLKKENWSQLSDTEKVNVLQTVANIEARYLGLSHELNVEISDLPKYRLGEYSNSTYRIIISLDELENYEPMRCVQTVCHESYHGYQHELIDLYNNSSEQEKELYLFRKAKRYKAEFEDYKDPDDDYEAYYRQECEEDARDYAEDSVYEYTYKIYGQENLDKAFDDLFGDICYE